MNLFAKNTVVFYCFHGVDILTINQKQSIVVNLWERHDIIIILIENIAF